jgi:hypothetical protein
MQVEVADKQLRSTHQFLEEQAAEREQERDDFLQEIAKLREQVREQDHERTERERLAKEVSFSFFFFFFGLLLLVVTVIESNGI